jgi:hypothetical protein
MKLYISNLTKQRHDFVYRVLGSQRIHHQMIEAGGQVLIHKDDQPEVIDNIIEQHTRYGLKPAAEVLSRKGFVGMCFAIDVPVKLDTIMAAFDQNATALVEANQEHRKNEAAAVHAGLANPESGGSTLGGLDLEVVEVPQTMGGDVNVNETISVSKDPERSEPRAVQGRRDRNRGR